MEFPFNKNDTSFTNLSVVESELVKSELSKIYSLCQLYSELISSPTFKVCDRFNLIYLLNSYLKEIVNITKSNDLEDVNNALKNNLKSAYEEIEKLRSQLGKDITNIGCVAHLKEYIKEFAEFIGSLGFSDYVKHKVDVAYKGLILFEVGLYIEEKTDFIKKLTLNSDESMLLDKDFNKEAIELEIKNKFPNIVISGWSSMKVTNQISLRKLFVEMRLEDV